MLYKTRKTVPKWAYSASILLNATLLSVMLFRYCHLKIEAYQTKARSERIEALISPLPTKELKLIQVEVEKPIYAIHNTSFTQKQKILSYIVEKFGEDAPDAITILNKCENHAFNPSATNHNSNGTIDRGVFQINSIHGGEEMFDWKTNVDEAYKIFTSHGRKWTPWSCAYVVGQTPFWQL